MKQAVELLFATDSCIEVLNQASESGTRTPEFAAASATGNSSVQAADKPVLVWSLFFTRTIPVLAAAGRSTGGYDPSTAPISTPLPQNVFVVEEECWADQV